MFSRWEIETAKRLISEFKQRWTALAKEDAEDLMQECFLHWYSVKQRYDPEKDASIKTYMTRVIRNKLFDLVKSHRRDKRKVSAFIDELKEDYPAFVAKSQEEPGKYQLDLDLSKAMSKLTPRQKKLCRLLEQGLNKSEAARRLGVKRTTLYHDLKRIEQVFEKQGLKRYRR